MIQSFKNIYAYRELIAVMAWKQLIVRYKQSYLGLIWAVLKPLTLMLVFTLLNSFIGDHQRQHTVSGHIIYRAHPLDLLSGVDFRGRG